MCGLAGVICQDGGIARLALRAMVDAQRHRGPDGGGEHYLPMGDATLGLGHRRLSIIDLSAQGAQPMVHPHTGDVLVYNGEIYNYRDLKEELSAGGTVFLGDSDSEVLLHALVEWGPRALSRLQGMFAFAFYRVATGEMMLARDPLGIKPLYVGRRGRTFVFASEVRAILASGMLEPQIDPRGIAGLFSYGACQHPYTMFRNIRSLPAGAWQVMTARGEEEPPVHYWSPPRPESHLSRSEAVDAVRSTLEASVRDHLVSDVPVGVFLSSGLDSTIVAGIAARHASTLRSFTVGFAENPDLSELELAGDTARRFGLDHTEIRIESADAIATTEAWLDAIDMPSIDGLNVYVISKAVREHGITVALSGQGGDELFGGYSSFVDVPRLYRMLRHASWLPAPKRRRLAELLSAGKPTAFRAKAAALAESGADLTSLYTHRRRLMAPAQMNALGLDARWLGLDENFLDPEEMEAMPVNPRDPIWSVGLLESRLYMGNMLLRDGDADGMAHSLEIRVPLLDRRLVDLAFGLPGRVRLPNGRADKHMLRAAMPDLLRPELLNQPKHGFTLPIRRWMRGPLAESCRSGFEHLRASGLVEAKGLEALWSTFVAEPESPAWSRAFACCVLGHYLRRTARTSPAREYAS